MLVVDIPLISSSSMPLPFANLFFQESQPVLIPSSQNTTHDFPSPPSQPQPPLHETSQDLPTPPSTMIHTLHQTIFLQQVIKLLLLRSYNHNCLLSIRYEFNIVIEDGLTNGHENLLLTLLLIISLSTNQATTRKLSPHLNHLIGNWLCNLNTSLF